MLPKNRRNVFSHKNVYIAQVIQVVIFNFIVFLTNVYVICCYYNKIAMVKMCKKLKMERILENLFFLLFDTYIFCFQTSYAFSTSPIPAKLPLKRTQKKQGSLFLRSPAGSCSFLFIFSFVGCYLRIRTLNILSTLIPLHPKD